MFAAVNVPKVEIPSGRSAEATGSKPTQGRTMPGPII
jgi:hypothetical protein